MHQAFLVSIMSKKQANRKYRDSSFTYIFGKEHGKKFLLQIANFMKNTNYTNVDDVEITTLGNVLIINIKNDVSFVIAPYLFLMEHQSSESRNMTIRQLEYYVDVLDNYMIRNNLDVHRTYFIRIDVPLFITFYEGDASFPEFHVEKLSDHFKFKTEQPSIELINLCYNLGEGMNLELKKACPALGEYHWLCHTIQEKAKRMPREQAIEETLKEMPKDFEIYPIMHDNNLGVKGMLIKEYDEEYIKKLSYDNGYDKGKEEGKEEGAESERSRNFESFVEGFMREDGLSREAAEVKTKKFLCME